jgi:hypothetical protein
MKKLGSHWTDFREIWYLSIILESAEKFQILLKSDKNDSYITWRPVHICDHIWLSST